MIVCGNNHKQPGEPNLPKGIDVMQDIFWLLVPINTQIPSNDDKLSRIYISKRNQDTQK